MNIRHAILGLQRSDISLGDPAVDLGSWLRIRTPHAPTWVDPGLPAAVRLGIVAGALAALVIGTPVGAQSKAPSATDEVRIEGWAVNMSNIAPGTNQRIQITIDRWTSPFDKRNNAIELENYSSQPVRLNNLTIDTR
jgi:hypothetical protein